MNNCQVAIIGAGPGGYETAIRLNQYGISVTCFEMSRIGGTCLNEGCIPTKALVKSAELFHEINNCEEYGLIKTDIKFDYKRIYERKNKIVEKLVTGIDYLFQKRNIPIINKKITTIEKKGDLFQLFSCDESMGEFNYIIIATGSESKHLPFLPFDNDKIIDSKSLLDLNDLPQSIAIIGGGVIGCEFASIFKLLGIEVSIIEFLPEILPTEDIDISKKLLMSFKKNKINVLTNTAVESANIDDDNVELMLSNGKTLKTKKVLVSIGRKPVFNIETKGFDINFEKNFISVDSNCQTSIKNIFAIGDVTGKLMLAHTASKQGFLVADRINHLLFNKEMVINPINYQNIPSCIFTTPEVASCGFREVDTQEMNVSIGKFPYSANGRALISGASNGLVKTIINNDTQEIIGIHIIGYLATELITSACILINTKQKVSDVANIVFAHPTISECLMESIEDTHKMAIHTI